MSRGDRFKRRALKRGYKVDEVDEFLERAESTLAGEAIGDPLTPEDVRDVVFRTRWGGYDEWQVDLHLDRLERELDELHSGAAGRRGSNGFPALPPAARDREDRLALPPGQSATTYGSSQAELPPPPPAPAAAPNATVYVAENNDPRVAPPRQPEPEEFVRPGQDVAYANQPASPAAPAAYRAAEPTTYGAPEPPPGPTAPEADGFADSFAALGSPTNDYEDPFADHTPKPTFHQNFHSVDGTQNPPPYPDPSVPEPRIGAPEPAAYAGTTYGAPAEPPPPPAPPAAKPQPAIDPYAGRHGKVDMTVELPAYGGQVSPFTNEDKAMLADLRSGFKTRRFGSGYDSSQVDRLFDAMAAAMDGQATAQITDADFDSTQFGLVQGGYFEDEVETALSTLRDLFKRRMG